MIFYNFENFRKAVSSIEDAAAYIAYYEDYAQFEQMYYTYLIGFPQPVINIGIIKNVSKIQ